MGEQQYTDAQSRQELREMARTLVPLILKEPSLWEQLVFPEKPPVDIPRERERRPLGQGEDRKPEPRKPPLVGIRREEQRRNPMRSERRAQNRVLESPEMQGLLRSVAINRLLFPEMKTRRPEGVPPGNIPALGPRSLPPLPGGGEPISRPTAPRQMNVRKFNPFRYLGVE